MATDDETESGVVGITGIVPLGERSPIVESTLGDALPIGAWIGSYSIEYLIGGGGGGIVYAARHRVLGRRVAIKVLRGEMARYPVMVARFLLEATAVNKIGHPNIVDIHEFGEAAPGRPYYVMEFLDGMDLRKYLQMHGRFSASEALALLEPVCRAVQAAHDAGFIHRDIKANNIVVVEAEGGRIVKLLDFGIAKMFQSEGAAQGLTEPGVQLGTVHNMAPEQIRCESVDARTDIYALGVLMYQLLTGHYPFHADDPRQIALLHLQAPPPRPGALAPVSPSVDAVVLRCLQKRPDQRFASVSELVAALRGAVGEAGPDSVESQSRAVGVYFEVVTTGDEEMEDEMFEDVINILDTVEQELAARDFTFPLRTSNALLGVRLVTEADVERERALATAVVGELRAALAERPHRHPGVDISASVSVEQALCRASSGGVEIVGGPIFEVETWTVSIVRTRG